MSAQRAKQMVETAGWLRMNGDPEGARRLLEQALQLDPTNAAARTLLASFPAAGAPRAPAAPPPAATPAPGRTTPVPQVPPLVPPLAGRAPASPTPPPSTPTPWPAPSTPAPSAWDAAPGKRVVLDEPPRAAPSGSGGVGDPFHLVSPPPRRSLTPPPPASDVAGGEPVEVLLQGVRDLLDLDDHTGAMELLSKAESQAPGHPEVQRMREESERVLMAMLESKLGDLQKRPRVRLKDDEIIWLNLDHRAGFVLAQIDGSVTYDDLFALSGMSRLDTARILAQLVQEGVVG
jgi:hypothetical protein